MTGPLDKNDLNALNSAVRGRVYLPDSEGYDDARQVWNAMIDRRPGAIVRAAGVADVMATVNFARERGLPVAIRGGGHNVAGNAVCDDGIVLDLGALKSVRVDPARSTAQAGGGVLWREFDHETQTFGLASTGGAISTTGIAGLTLGGGFGYLARRRGMSCDNLVSADVVTAAGELVTASAESHPDLFWALRGGGGNFGVVTSFEYQLHPQNGVLSGMIAFPVAMAKSVLRRFRDVALEAGDDFTLLAGIMSAPTGERIAAVVFGHLGSEQEGLRAIRPIRELGSILVDTSARLSYCAMQQQLDAAYPKGVRNYWKSTFLKSLSDEAIEIMIEGAANPLSPLNHVVLESYGGAIARVPKDATAFDHRDSPFNLMILALSSDSALDQEQMSWARSLFQRFSAHSTGGAYVNYLSDGEDVHTAYGDARFRRLAAIKAIYDPGNLFRFNQNIPPAETARAHV
jgi:FAD/FMN-containing dehydrogenase